MRKSKAMEYGIMVAVAVVVLVVGNIYLHDSTFTGDVRSREITAGAGVCGVPCARFDCPGNQNQYNCDCHDVASDCTCTYWSGACNCCGLFVENTAIKYKSNFRGKEAHGYLTRRIYTESDGLSNRYVNDIVRDGDYVWVATADGVSRLDLLTDTWKRFNVKDGLPHRFATCVAVDEDSVWVGTRKGIARYRKIFVPEENMAH